LLKEDGLDFECGGRKEEAENERRSGGKFGTAKTGIGQSTMGTKKQVAN